MFHNWRHHAAVCVIGLTWLFVLPLGTHEALAASHPARGHHHHEQTTRAASALTPQGEALCEALGDLTASVARQRDQGITLREQLLAFARMIPRELPSSEPTHTLAARVARTVYAHPEIPPAVAHHRFVAWCLTVQPLGSDPLMPTQAAPWR